MYASTCAHYHQANGQGVPGSFTALAGNSVANGLDDQQLPSVIPYVRSARGNSAPPVTPDQIKAQR